MPPAKDSKINMRMFTEKDYIKFWELDSRIEHGAYETKTKWRSKLVDTDGQKSLR